MRKILISIITIIYSCSPPVAQDQSNNEEVNSIRERFAKMEADALSQAYSGIFTHEGKIENLFPVYSTGVSTEPIAINATVFLNSLTSEQLTRVSFEIDDEEWRKWSNVDNGIYQRQGLSLKEMNEGQKAAAFELMQVSLSAKGMQLSKDIMKTDQTLKELNNGSSDYDEELYFFTIMGKPSQTEPWGWQLDGHHLVINYFVLGDQVVMSPVFMGAEPVITTSGKYDGNTLFQDEEYMGLAFMQSLSDEQQTVAAISKLKTDNNNVAQANKDNLILDFQGIQGANLTRRQKSDLLNLVYQYISNMREGHQQVKMEEVTRHIDNTWFSWVGETTKDAVFYYRIHSPVVLIEFDHQRIVGIPNADDGKPSKNHIHTVVRTPNGNDYGKDLLKQHLKTHKH